MTRPIRAGLYARVSTAEQQTLPEQVAKMRQYAECRGWTVTVCVEDIGSGAKERPKRQEMLRIANRREIDVILVLRLDRWGRSVPDLMVTLKDLSDIGVNFVAIEQSIDLTTSSGRALVGMLAVFAEFERDLLRERVKSGMQAAQKRGKHCGRPADARVKYDEVRELFSQGLNKTQIAEKLGIGRTSVIRALQPA